MKKKSFEEMSINEKELYFSGYESLYAKEAHPLLPKPVPFFQEPKIKLTKKKRITEASFIHIPLVNWFRKTYPQYARALMHFANEGKRTKIGGAYLKMMGLRPGVSDLFLSLPCGNFSGFWIEFKLPKKVPSESQVEFMKDMNLYGYKVLWTDCLVKAKQELVAYMDKYLTSNSRK